MKLNWTKINLKNITMPLLNVMAEFDHLVPNDSSKPLSNAVSGTDNENNGLSYRSYRNICWFKIPEGVLS
jgi:poly(3-hydroxyalkanoate) synthetase